MKSYMACSPSNTTCPTRPVVCHVLHTLQVGGGEVLARAFALANIGQFRPVFAVLDEVGHVGEDLRRQGYAVEVMERRPGFDFACALRLRQFLVRHEVAIIHAHQYGPLLYSALARLPARRVPILFTEHGRDYPDHRRWKRVWANRLLLASEDRFVAVGDAVRRALVEFEGLPAHRIQVIYNGRDLGSYDASRPVRNEVRREFGITEKQFVVIQVARLDRLKDYPTALQAMRRVVQERPDARLLVVGDGEERARLKRMAQSLDLCEYVRFIGSRNDVPRLLQAADVFLLSSISEGIPLTLIEAMATGIPCVATKVGGVPEVIVDGQTGVLSEAGNAAGLATGLLRLARDSRLRHQFGCAGRRRMLERFDARQMHDSYRALYRRMAGMPTENGESCNRGVDEGR